MIIEQISANSKGFELCYVNYERLEMISAPLKHVDLKCEFQGKYLHKFLGSADGQTRLLFCNLYQKKSLYVHLLEKSRITKLYGHSIVHEIVNLLD